MEPRTSETLCTNGFMIQRKNRKFSSGSHVRTTKVSARPGPQSPRRAAPDRAGLICGRLSFHRLSYVVACLKFYLSGLHCFFLDWGTTQSLFCSLLHSFVLLVRQVAFFLVFLIARPRRTLHPKFFPFIFAAENSLLSLNILICFLFPL